MKTIDLTISALSQIGLSIILASAQTTTGAPGSPSATTILSGEQLPPPDPKFGGVIEDGALQSKPWWLPRVVPPQGAPNVLLIITDDAGFAVPSTFGVVIPTPPMDRIAGEGLRYNRVFSIAPCSLSTSVSASAAHGRWSRDGTFRQPPPASKPLVEA